MNRTTRSEGGCFDYALGRGVERALTVVPEFAAGGPGVVALVAPRETEPEGYIPSILELIKRKKNGERPRDGSLLVIRSDDTPAKIRKNVDREMLDNHRVVFLTAHDAPLPPVVRVAIDAILHIPPLTAGDFQVACKSTLGLKITLPQARRVLGYPREIIEAAIRPGRSIEDVLIRLALHYQASPTKVMDRYTLSDMHGYGDAKAWGLRLAEDIAAWKRGSIPWSDVDKGIVLFGPPGVGKTIYARALATECNVEVVATSLAQWQSADRGHLGDCLKAMRKAFADAKAKTPCILFIDELDSIGDREKFTEDNDGYSRQVVNSFLELLDGLGDRDGVIVVGATNDLSRIDAAVLRAGRLDKQVEISKPTPDERLAILEQLTGLTLDVASKQSLTLSTNGMTGADLAKITRDARRVARQNNWQMTAQDLLVALPALKAVPDDFLRCVAIHETGHTLVGVHLKCGEYMGTVVSQRLPAQAMNHQCGVATFEISEFRRQDRQCYLDRIALLLAGIAAEEVWLGSHSDGCVADLEMATRAATIMHTASGMGTTLRYSDARSDAELETLRRTDPQLRQSIDEVLAEQLARAKDILEKQRGLGDMLVDELMTGGSVTPERLAKMMSDSGSQRIMRDDGCKRLWNVSALASVEGNAP